VTTATSLVFDEVTVVDVEQGKLLPAQRVVIVGNRIQAVGSASAVPVPRDAQVVKAKGKFLIPGLWDMHVHPERESEYYYPLFLAHGVTGIRIASSGVPLDTLIQERKAVLDGTRAGPPRQLIVGPGLAEVESRPCLPDYVEGGVAQHRIICLSRADAVRVVDSLKAAGADMLKMYALGRDTYLAVAAEARRQGLPFGGHLDAYFLEGDKGLVADTPMPSALEASDSGASIIDHGHTSAEVGPACLSAWDDVATVAKCQPLAEHLRRNGTWIQPTLINLMATGGGVGNIPFNDRAKAALEREAERTSAFFANDSTWRINAPANLLSRGGGSSPSGGVLSVAQQVGLPLLAGTDVTWQRGAVLPGLGLHTELEMFVAEGLTPLEALQAATLNPAKSIHGTDSLGTVVPGKLADLVLLDADPLADITNTTTIRAVVANGRYFDRAAIDSLLVKAQAKANAQP
jgi:hypothetical protein